MVNTKICQRCGCEFSRGGKLSEKQWNGRRFCSNSCGSKKIDIPDSDIIDMYCNEKLSSNEISLKTGISGVHVLRILNKNGIDRRSMSEGKILSHSKPEVKDKLRLALRGRKLSEEAKDKLRKRTGEKNANWNFGLTLHHNGYLYFTASTANGAHAGKALHVVIAEWLYQRKLDDGEVVHHIDGNKLNNAPDNLCILTGHDHAKIHEFGEKHE